MHHKHGAEDINKHLQSGGKESKQRYNRIKISGGHKTQNRWGISARKADTLPYKMASETRPSLLQALRLNRVSIYITYPFFLASLIWTTSLCGHRIRESFSCLVLLQ